MMNYAKPSNNYEIIHMIESKITEKFSKNALKASLCLWNIEFIDYLLDNYIDDYNFLINNDEILEESQYYDAIFIFDRIISTSNFVFFESNVLPLLKKNPLFVEKRIYIHPIDSNKSEKSLKSDEEDDDKVVFYEDDFDFEEEEEEENEEDKEDDKFSFFIKSKPIKISQKSLFRKANIIFLANDSNVINNLLFEFDMKNDYFSKLIFSSIPRELWKFSFINVNEPDTYCNFLSSLNEFSKTREIHFS